MADARVHAGWQDHYRPGTLDEMALAPSVRQHIMSCIPNGVLTSHLILHGPPGTGKTSLAEVIADQLYQGSHVLRVKASETRGIDFIRDTVLMYLKVLKVGGRGLVIFSEAAGLTPEAQKVLLDALEGVLAKHNRVILTTNDIAKLIQPLRDRCEEIEMGTPPLDECVRVLARILKVEGVEVHAQDVFNFVNGHFAARGATPTSRGLPHML